MRPIKNRGINTTSGNLYFLAVDLTAGATPIRGSSSSTYMEIQFVPQVIDRMRETDVSAMKIVGRNTPRYQIVNGETTMSLTLDFYAEEELRVATMARVRWLEALSHTDAGQKPHKTVYLVWGELFKNDAWVVKSVKSTLSNFSKPHGYMPQQATVDITLLLDAKKNLSWEDVAPDPQMGTRDGSNPISLGMAARNDDSLLLDIDPTNNNTFQEILRRVTRNLRYREIL